MKNLLIISFNILVLSFFVSCSSEGGSGSKSAGKKGPKLEAASGGAYYGGVFKMNEEEYFRSLYPLNITEVTGHRIASQVYEGLVNFNQKDLSVEPGIASSWEIDDSGTVYTFTLRDGVFFHDNDCFPGGKGRTVTAQDVKYNFDRWCAYDVNNKGYDFIKDRIVGAKEHFAATQKGQNPEGGCRGIKVIDDKTVQVSITQPFGGFLNMLALPFGYIYPKESVDKYGIEMRAAGVGTGPFILKSVKDNDAVILTRNKSYWQKDKSGNQLPFLDAVKWSFIKDKKAELHEFKSGKLDMIYRFPLEMVDEMIDQNGKLIGDFTSFQYQESPSMTLQYYGFKQFGEIFNNKKLRQAFCYAVDRKKIVDFTLKGAGVPGNYGVVPPAFKTYPATQVKGYKFNPAKAKKLLAEAGYPDGKGFPEIDLQINSGGGRNEQIAEAIQKMINENLNIKVNITKMPFAQHLEAVETSKSEFWRAGWIADYPDPENFINLFRSEHIPPKLSDRSYLNTWRWRNADYDRLYHEAQKITDDKERNLVYLKMDQIVTDEAPLMPILYSKDRRLQQANVRNFPQNAMEYRNLKDVYFVPE